MRHEDAEAAANLAVGGATGVADGNDADALGLDGSGVGGCSGGGVGGVGGGGGGGGAVGGATGVDFDERDADGGRRRSAAQEALVSRSRGDEFDGGGGGGGHGRQRRDAAAAAAAAAAADVVTDADAGRRPLGRPARSARLRQRRGRRTRGLDAGLPSFFLCYFYGTNAVAIVYLVFSQSSKRDSSLFFSGTRLFASTFSLNNCASRSFG